MGDSALSREGAVLTEIIHLTLRCHHMGDFTMRREEAVLTDRCHRPSNSALRQAAALLTEIIYTPNATLSLPE